jgi:riboflavin kinase/FMN adenylyltransferase
VQRWESLADVPDAAGPSVVTIGVFDGVHRGHRVGLARTVELARERGAAATVVTFEPHPLSVVRPEVVPPRLSTLRHRLELLAEMGIDAVLVLPFTAEVAGWSPQEFVERVLVDALGAVGVVVGEDFRFGHKAAGDLSRLERLGADRGFAVHGVPIEGDVERWSSTRARELVAAGDVAGAAAVLGRLHRVEGEVVHGDHRGRAIGYPTANLAPPPPGSRGSPDDPGDPGEPGGTASQPLAVPADGIYAGWLVRHLGGPEQVRLPAAISVGTNPTFDGVDRRVEAHVLDRDDLELYGEQVAVEFTERLRETVRFDSVDDLVRQMDLDVARARGLLRPS